MELPGRWTPGLDSQALSRQTLKDSTETMIRRALLNGAMKPGEIYSANALASQLGISNSPAREAMMSLVNKGLLELVRNRGFRVVELSQKDKQEVYELRRLMEVEAVRRAAERTVDDATAAELRALAQKTVELSAQGDIAAYLEADQTFHSALVGRLGNSRWSEIVDNLRDQSRVNGAYSYLQDGGLMPNTAHEHLEIVEAVLAGDGDRASELMIEHLDYARR